MTNKECIKECRDRRKTFQYLYEYLDLTKKSQENKENINIYDITCEQCDLLLLALKRSIAIETLNISQFKVKEKREKRNEVK